MTKKPNLADALRSEQRVPQSGAKTPENNGEKIQLNFRLDPEVLYQFKLLALEKGKPMQTLFCEAMKKIFIENNRPPIAK